MDNAQVEAALAHLINTPYSVTVKQQITELTGRTRVVGPNEAMTLNIDPGRIGVNVEAGLITGFSFG